MTNDQARLRERLEKAKLRVSDLTRALDESLGIEQEQTTAADLERARQVVLELERKLGLREDRDE